MYLDFDNLDLLEINFKRELNWFEKEFEILFGNKLNGYTLEDRALANKVLDLLSEVINYYPAEELLFYLVSSLNRIKQKYPELFKR
jgi:hypothetical protein